MIKIRLNAKGPKISEIVNQLKKDNFIKDVDYNFDYYPAYYDLENGDELREKMFSHAIFTFWKNEYATLFLIKYSHYSPKLIENIEE